MTGVTNNKRIKINQKMAIRLNIGRMLVMLHALDFGCLLRFQSAPHWGFALAKPPKLGFSKCTIRAALHPLTSFLG